jgi:hypothetical protein
VASGLGSSASARTPLELDRVQHYASASVNIAAAPWDAAIIAVRYFDC